MAPKLSSRLPERSRLPVGRVGERRRRAEHGGMPPYRASRSFLITCGSLPVPDAVDDSQLAWTARPCLQERGKQNPA